MSDLARSLVDAAAEAIGETTCDHMEHLARRLLLSWRRWPRPHARRLYWRLVEINRGGWQVAIETNTAALYTSLLEGEPCPTCHVN